MIRSSYQQLSLRQLKSKKSENEEENQKKQKAEARKRKTQVSLFSVFDTPVVHSSGMRFFQISFLCRSVRFHGTEASGR